MFYFTSIHKSTKVFPITKRKQDFSLRLLFRRTTRSGSQAREAGALIGSLERLLTLCFVLLGEFEVIGFIIAAKSILRFKDNERPKTEYVLAGTLLSFGIAILMGILLKYKYTYLY